MTSLPRRLQKWIVLALTFVAIGCSAPPTEGTSSGLDDLKSDTAEKLDDVTTALEGLDPKERREQLIKLAQEEGSSFTLYGVTSLEEMSESIDAFESDTGITVNYFRAGSEDVLQRLVEEARAGFRGADAVNENGAEMTYLAREGLFSPLETPVSEALPHEGVKEDWFWSYVDIFAPAWNTELVSASEAPKTWEDVLTDFGSDLMMEVGDIDWFATLVKHLIAEGSTEEEALSLVREGASEATFVDGHTLMVELLASGEFAVAATPYWHRVTEFKSDGAPIEVEPAVAPLIARPEGVAVHATAEHPAAALLFVEWYLTDGQEIGLSQDRQPASTAVPGGGLPTEYENIVVDVDAVIDELDKWSSLYDEVIQLSDEDVIED